MDSVANHYKVYNKTIQGLWTLLIALISVYFRFHVQWHWKNHYPWSPCALPIDHEQNNVFHVFGRLFYCWRFLFQASLFIRPNSVDYSGAAVQMVETGFVEKSSRLFATSSSSLFFLSASYRVPKATCKIEWHVDASAFSSSNLRKKAAGIWDASQTTMIQILFLSGCLYRRKSAIFFQRGQCSRPYLICCLISSVNYDNKMIARLPWPNKRPKAIPFPFTTSCSGVFGSVRPLRIDTTGTVWMIHDPTTDRIGDCREPPPALDILPHAPGSSSGPSRFQVS